MKSKFLVLGLCFLAACQPRVNSRGNITVEENLGQFIEGKTTMDDVLQKCGTPSLHQDNYSWIYIGSKVEEDNFKKIKLTYQFIVKMTFDQNKILKRIERITSNEKDDDSFMNMEFTRLMNDKQALKKMDKVLENVVK
jgi:outer membrane protein assembly factor BamE (lipoprotein component of BamABCDE complex)